MALWHLTLATEGRLPFFTAGAGLRGAVRALMRVAGPHAVLFNVVDDHVHLVVDAADARAVGHLGRAVLLALRPRSAAPMDPARIRPVTDRGHLQRLVGYVLGQTVHHGLPAHPALWDGACFPDLVGARILGFRNRLADLLPRLRPSEVWAAVGLRRESPLEPAADPALRAAGAVRLREAAAAALAAPPGLSGSAAPVQEARAVLVGLGLAAGFSTRDLAAAAEVPIRTVQRLAHRDVPEPVRRAVRLRVAIEDLVRFSPPMSAEPTAPYRASVDEILEPSRD